LVSIKKQVRIGNIGIRSDCIGGFNQEDGVIKGHAEQGLKQASTIPDRTPIYFKDIDAEIMIPSSCIAFAERFFTEGELFTGFITESANLIFDSIGRKAS